jgi:hypothetical protein
MPRTSRYAQNKRKQTATFREMAREVLFCIVLPGAVFVAVDMAAQKGIHPSAQQQADDQIAAAINNKLMDSDTLRPLGLGVWVHGDGIATLTGNVPNQALQDQVDSIVRMVRGVKLVDDQITVGATPAQPPASTTLQPGHTPPQNNGMGASLAPPAVGVTASASAIAAGTPALSQAQTPANPEGGPNAAFSRPLIQATNPNIGQYRHAEAQNDQPEMTVPAGTPVRVMLLQTLDSKHAKPGTGFQAVLAQDVRVNGVTALPRGAPVEGTVVDARNAGHLAGGPKLALQLFDVRVGGTHYPLTTQAWAHQGPGKGGETASSVAGGAGIGAIAGAMAGGGPVALLGAAIGGLGGAGLSALSPRARVLAPAESVLTFRLTGPLTVREPTVKEMQDAAANLPPQQRAPAYRRRVYYPYPPPPPYGPPD